MIPIPADLILLSLFASMLKLGLNTNYIYSRCIGMIKPQRTQRKQRKGREMNDSGADGFDIAFCFRSVSHSPLR